MSDFPNDPYDGAARMMGDLLTSQMFAAYNDGHPTRVQFYIWEARAVRWLERFMKEYPGASVGSDWVRSFCKANPNPADNAQINFNLRALVREAGDGG